MKRFINFCKEKYRILIPIMVVFVLLVTVFFLYREYKFDNTRNKIEYNVRQYFGGIETNYIMIATYNLNNQIVSVSDKLDRVNYDATPVYFNDEEKVLFPEEMTIAFPLENGMQYKLFKFSTYDGKDINNNNEFSGNYSNFFLFDGKGLYFFPKEVTLYIDNKEYVTLGDMSYVSIVGGYTMVYYDYSNDKAEFLEIEGKKITVKSDIINVDLSNKSFISFSNKILLFSPNNLDTIYKIN